MRAATAEGGGGGAGGSASGGARRYGPTRKRVVAVTGTDLGTPCHRSLVRNCNYNVGK